MELELVGKIGVDSGQVMVGDPCYLTNWEDKVTLDETVSGARRWDAANAVTS